jgi:hypothetical protein
MRITSFYIYRIAARIMVCFGRRPLEAKLRIAALGTQFAKRLHYGALAARNYA